MAARAGSLAITFVDGLTSHKLIAEAAAMEKQAADALKAVKEASWES